MGCNSSKSHEDDGFHVEHGTSSPTNISSPQQTSNRSNATTNNHKQTSQLLSFCQLFKNLDPHLSQSELEIWYTAIETFFETTTSSMLERYITSPEEIIIRKAFYGIEVTIDDIKQMNIKRLLETKKLSDQYISLVRYKLTKSGWLSKLGSVRKSWKSRYFILCEGTLRYYEHDMSKEQEQQHIIKPKGEVRLQYDARIEEHSDHQHRFLLIYDPVNHPSGLWIEAADDDDKFAWIEAIKEQIVILGICHDHNIISTNFLYYLRLADKIFKLRLSSSNISSSTVASSSISTIFTNKASKESSSKMMTLQIILDMIKKDDAQVHLTDMIYEEWLNAIGFYYHWQTYEDMNNKNHQHDDMIIMSQHEVSSSQEMIIRKAVSYHMISSIDLDNIDAKLTSSQDPIDMMIGCNRMKIITSGWLKKEGHIVKNKKKRYFRLHEGWLRYYDDEELLIKKGEVKIVATADVVTSDFDSKAFTFVLNDVNDTYLLMESDTLEDKVRWMAAIKEQITWTRIMHDHNITDSNMLMHHRLAEKVLKLHLATGGNSINAIISSPSRTVSQADDDRHHASSSSSSPKPAINRLGSLYRSQPSSSSSLSSSSSSSSSSRSLGDFMMSLESHASSTYASMTRNDIELWVIAILLYLGLSEVTEEAVAGWQEMMIAPHDADVLHKAICDVDLSRDEFSGFDMKAFMTSGKLSEQLIFILRYQATTKGWLLKEGHFIKNWKKRYFVLNQGYLRYYDRAIDEPPYGVSLKGEVKLNLQSHIELQSTPDGKKMSKENMFILYGTVIEDDTKVQANTKQASSYLAMDAMNSEDKAYWIEALGEQIFIAGLLERVQVNATNLLHYLKLAEKLLTLHIASKK